MDIYQLPESLLQLFHEHLTVGSSRLALLYLCQYLKLLLQAMRS